MTHHIDGGKDAKGFITANDLPKNVTLEFQAPETDSEPVSIINEAAQASVTFELSRWQAFQVHMKLLSVPIWVSDDE